MKTLTFIRNKSPLAKLVRSPKFWAFSVFLLFAFPVFRSLVRKLPPPPPTLSQVPPFTLTNQFGRPFGSQDLKNKIYLASFAFTSCPTTCPKLMQNLKKIQKRVRGLGQKVHIVTLSVDPKNDTPSVLLKQARLYKSNPYIWTLLTGDEKTLRDLIVQGFQVPLGQREEISGKVDGQGVSLFDIAHTTKVALVDGKGGIRGYYPTDREGINRLMIDLGLLANLE